MEHHCEICRTLNVVLKCWTCGDWFCRLHSRSCVCGRPLCVTHFHSHYSLAHDLRSIRREMEGSSQTISTLQFEEGESCPEKEKRIKVSIGVATWNIHKLSAGGDAQETAEKIRVINELFRNNPWLDVICLQEVNRTGIPILGGKEVITVKQNDLEDDEERPKKKHKKTVVPEGLPKQEFELLSPGPLMIVQYGGKERYWEHYPILVRKGAKANIQVTGIELYWGTGKVTEINDISKPVTYKGEGAPDDIKNRPLMVYTLKKADCDKEVKVGVVHTSPGYGSQFERVQIFNDQVKHPLALAKEDDFVIFLGDYYLPMETRVQGATEHSKSESEILKKQIDLKRAQADYRERFGPQIKEIDSKIRKLDRQKAALDEKRAGTSPELEKLIDEATDIQWDINEILKDQAPDQYDNLEYGDDAPITRKKDRSQYEVELRIRLAKVKSKINHTKKLLRKQAELNGEFARLDKLIRELDLKRKVLVAQRKELENLWPEAGVNAVRNVAGMTFEKNLAPWQSIVGPVSGTNIHGKDFNPYHVRNADYCISSGPWLVKSGGLFKDLPLMKLTGCGGCLLFDESGIAIQNWMKISDHAPAGGYFANFDDGTANKILCLDERTEELAECQLAQWKQREEKSRDDALQYERKMKEKAHKEWLQQQEIGLLLKAMKPQKGDGLFSFCQAVHAQSRSDFEMYEEQRALAQSWSEKPIHTFEGYVGADFDHEGDKRFRKPKRKREEENVNNAQQVQILQQEDDVVEDEFNIEDF